LLKICFAGLRKKRKDKSIINLRVDASGLDLLKEFVRLNQGKLEIYSNDGYAIVDKDGERYENRELAFEGTVVHITLRCNEQPYRFFDEAE
jgi:hypothetical protein